MLDVLLDQVVYTDYGQFTLEWGPDVWDGDDERFFAEQLNGWVGAAVSDTVYLVLGRRSGGSGLRIERLDAPPTLDEEAEDIVEVSFTVPDGTAVRWATWADEHGGLLNIPSGSWRLRISARGRDRGREGEFEESVVDQYTLQAWPARPERDAVLRTTSEDAGYWNDTWGGRRPR